MNILIDNYLNKEDSQCLYLYHAIKSLDENQVKAFYWPSRDISTYDIFDDTKPDIFISHAELWTMNLACTWRIIKI